MLNPIITPLQNDSTNKILFLENKNYGVHIFVIVISLTESDDNAVLLEYEQNRHYKKIFIFFKNFVIHNVTFQLVIRIIHWMG